MNKIFPIKSDTACLLKWSWSTIFLSIGTTSSCHRVNHDLIDVDNFDDFHNTPAKIRAREAMRRGEWPKQGCEYCEEIEKANGVSDRLFQLKNMQYDIPPELKDDLNANQVTPTTLEVYFNNTCNMACLYCGPHFSSVWEAENNTHGSFRNGSVSLLSTESVNWNKNYDKMLDKFWEWFRKKGHNLDILSILGGEPFYQKEFSQILDFFEKNPYPNLRLNISTNLKTEHLKFKRYVDNLIQLKERKKLGEIQISASIDTWGDAAEFIRWGLDLKQFSQNFEYLLSKDMIICINAAINALSIKSMPDLIDKIRNWNQIRLEAFNNDRNRKINLSFMTVNYPVILQPDIFDESVFHDDFEIILKKMQPNDNDREYFSNSYEHMLGISKQIAANPKDKEKIEDLKVFLDEMDKRRKTNWREIFPWLIEQ